jgi:hypothetical protein
MMQPLILQVWRNPAALAQLDGAGWDLLLRQADSANLGAALYYLLEQHGLLAAAPVAVRDRLDWARVVAERHVLAVRWEVNRISQAVATTGVPLILLKGAAYTMAHLPPGQGRLYSDIDVLVPQAHIGDVEVALMAHGWDITGYDDYDQRYYRQWMHELPPMTHMRRETTIDVHHAILPLTARAHPDPDKLRAAAVPVDGEDGLLTLSPVDMVLHSAVHLFFSEEYRHGLRDLLDLQRLLAHFGQAPGFWQSLAGRAAELGLERPLFYACRYCHLLLDMVIPDAMLALPRPGKLLTVLMDALFLRALMPMHASCGVAGAGAARFLLYVRGHWMRMPPLMLTRHLLHKAFLSTKSPAAE